MNKVCVGVDNHSGKGGRSDTSTDSGRRKHILGQTGHL
jgi:hypothetical protein